MIDIEDARRHADAMADTGCGYTATKGWIVSCLWCDWYRVAPTKADGVALYRTHERATQGEWDRLGGHQ